MAIEDLYPQEEGKTGETTPPVKDTAADDPAEIRPVIEALLFATNQPLTTKRLTEITGRERREILQAIDDLQNEYDSTNRAFQIEEIAGGFLLLSRKEYHRWVIRLEKKVQELQDAGDTMAAYMLDSAGVVALGAVGEALRCLVEDTAAELGWGVSPSLSPGSLVGWSLRDQRALCSLLPLEEIGVHLTRYNVLEPHKSASGLVGLGPDYDSAHVGSVCKYCALQDTCWRRREDPS